MHPTDRCSATHNDFGRCVFGKGHSVEYHSDGSNRWPAARNASPVRRICPCETQVEDPGPHISACPWADPTYEPGVTTSGAAGDAGLRPTANPVTSTTPAGGPEEAGITSADSSSLDNAMAALEVIKDAVRRETIETCAQLCAEESNSYNGDSADLAEARIRALLKGRRNVTQRCFFFGCWNVSGHFMHGPGDHRERDRLSYYGGDRHVHLDGSLAPRRMKEGTRAARLFELRPIWTGMGDTRELRQRLEYDSEEYPQGEFLLHKLDTGFTAIQWWDRTQGDQRGACNSTVLLEGAHDASAMRDALASHFPHVLANLTKAGVTLREVTVATPFTRPDQEKKA